MIDKYICLWSELIKHYYLLNIINYFHSINILVIKIILKIHLSLMFRYFVWIDNLILSNSPNEGLQRVKLGGRFDILCSYSEPRYCSFHN